LQTITDAFFAGFLEGEGSFRCYEDKGSWRFSIELTQKRIESLSYIQHTHGGTMYFNKNGFWSLRFSGVSSCSRVIKLTENLLLAKRREALAMSSAIKIVQKSGASRVGQSATLDRLCFSVIAMKGVNSRDDVGYGVPASAAQIEEYINRRDTA